MADNYLERQRADYELRKQAWLKKKRHAPHASRHPSIRKPDDEAL
ncbi:MULTISPECIES: dehydrogenase [Prevotella]|jgi:hypothetical protein|nr:MULTISPECIES: dehydrogenase [Prevotella]MDD6853500.1 dehydrogenase [Prevotella sp.]MDY6267075.1 dehydrogenase [Prevotella sp.]